MSEQMSCAREFLLKFERWCNGRKETIDALNKEDSCVKVWPGFDVCSRMIGGTWSVISGAAVTGISLRLATLRLSAFETEHLLLPTVLPHAAEFLVIEDMKVDGFCTIASLAAIGIAIYFTRNANHRLTSILHRDKEHTESVRSVIIKLYDLCEKQVNSDESVRHVTTQQLMANYCREVVHECNPSHVRHRWSDGKAFGFHCFDWQISEVLRDGSCGIIDQALGSAHTRLYSTESQNMSQATSIVCKILGKGFTIIATNRIMEIAEREPVLDKDWYSYITRWVWEATIAALGTSMVGYGIMDLWHAWSQKDGIATVEIYKTTRQLQAQLDVVEAELNDYKK